MSLGFTLDLTNVYDRIAATPLGDFIVRFREGREVKFQALVHFTVNVACNEHYLDLRLSKILKLMLITSQVMLSNGLLWPVW